tara:strand:- start:432 stop:1169 length:738 start_codon:yes stop_codon:yes gene_type:complete
MDKKNILILFLILFIIYFCFIKRKEKMSNTILEYDTKVEQLLEMTREYTTQKINEIYKADIESIRNLSLVSNKLQKDGLTIPGNLTVSGKFNYLPSGTIVIFNGTEAPSGWVICDGQNNTPDLRGRFVYGFGSGKNFGSKGGSETHTLTINQMPSHNHGGRTGKLENGKFVNDGEHTHKFKGHFVNKSGNDGKVLKDDNSNSNRTHNNLVTKDDSNHNHFISSQGQNQPHNNMPPYFVLSYIMKL